MNNDLLVICLAYCLLIDLLIDLFYLPFPTTKMQKYVKTFQNNRHYLACDATGLSRPRLLRFKTSGEFVFQTEMPTVFDHFVSIFMSALA